MNDEVFPFDHELGTLPTKEGTTEAPLAIKPGGGGLREYEHNLKPQQPQGLLDVEKSRAIQEVQAALIIAKRFPRDEVQAENKILIACQRYELAEKAMYKYPRGNETITGPSIRMAEVLLRYWGNAEAGFRELEKLDGKSIVEAFVWDKETNVRWTRQFTVEHRLQLKSGKMKELTDPRDQYEMVANYAQRRVRACILELIPGDVVSKAIEAIKATKLRGPKGAGPLIDRVKKAVVGFHSIGVSQERLEKRLKHKVEETTAEELSDLLDIFNAISDKQSKREDWFDFGEPEGSAAAALTEKLLGGKVGGTL